MAEGIAYDIFRSKRKYATLREKFNKPSPNQYNPYASTFYKILNHLSKNADIWRKNQKKNYRAFN